jgi:L-rhamnose mutarotase
MERICFLLSIKPGTGDEYDRRHREMWPELSSLIEQSGMRNYTIFRSGTTVVGYAECTPSFAATRAAEHDPGHIGRRWTEYMADIIDPPTHDEGFLLATEVWHLD